MAVMELENDKDEHRFIFINCMLIFIIYIKCAIIKNIMIWIWGEKK